VPVFAMLLIHGLMRERTLEDLAARTPWWLTAAAIGAMLFAIVISQSSSNAFIYFQF
jgi:alginate O-acetyltransferase complex protein AlgI